MERAAEGATLQDQPEPSPAIARYFAGREAVGETQVVWGGGTVPLRIAGYFTDELPPLEHISSVRCIVFKDDAVLVVREGEQGERAHVLPGGRREPGETLGETLERELLEETGWTVAAPRQIGVVWLHHLGPRPLGARPDSPQVRWYPDFLWVIYTAEAVAAQPEALLPGNPEGVAGFVPLAKVDALPIGGESRVFLERALAMRCKNREP
jgi:8-oxo-dGTP pyrophosphatase MutT (NUDIX family)